MEMYTEAGWILSAHNKERKICFGTEQEVNAYLNLLNSTRDVNCWEKTIIEVWSEDEEYQGFSIFEALRDEEDFDE